MNVTWLYMLVIAGISYIMGSLNGAIEISKRIYRKDIREFGSGNAGLTNFYRIFGVKRAIFVFMIDVIKTVVAILFGGWIMGYAGQAILGQFLAGLFVLLGHVFPIIYKFKGGKGVLTAATIAFMADWRIGVVTLSIFMLIVAITRYISLGSIIASIVFPFLVWIFVKEPAAILLSSLCIVIIIIQHNENIGRLAKGKEFKFTFHP